MVSCQARQPHCAEGGRKRIGDNVCWALCLIGDVFDTALYRRVGQCLSELSESIPSLRCGHSADLMLFGVGCCYDEICRTLARCWPRVRWALSDWVWYSCSISDSAQDSGLLVLLVVVSVRSYSNLNLPRSMAAAASALFCPVSGGLAGRPFYRSACSCPSQIRPYWLSFDV